MRERGLCGRQSEYLCRARVTRRTEEAPGCGPFSVGERTAPIVTKELPGAESATREPKRRSPKRRAASGRNAWGVDPAVAPQGSCRAGARARPRDACAGGPRLLAPLRVDGLAACHACRGCHGGGHRATRGSSPGAVLPATGRRGLPCPLRSALQRFWRPLQASLLPPFYQPRGCRPTQHIRAAAVPLCPRPKRARPLKILRSSLPLPS